MSRLKVCSHIWFVYLGYTIKELLFNKRFDSSNLSSVTVATIRSGGGGGEG